MTLLAPDLPNHKARLPNGLDVRVGSVVTGIESV